MKESIPFIGRPHAILENKEIERMLSILDVI